MVDANIPVGLAGMMTRALLASCILFMVGQGAIRSHQLALYWIWIIKLIAIFLVLLASVTLTTVWKNGSAGGSARARRAKGLSVSVLRANLYVLALVMVVPAALILPKRLKSPDFLAKRPSTAVAQRSAPSH